MVTYSDMFTYSLVIIGIIGLFIAADRKKEVTAPASKGTVTSFNQTGS